MRTQANEIGCSIYDVDATHTRREAQTHDFGPDWVGLWFKLAEEVHGEYVGMRAGRPRETEIKWEFLPHYEFDGAGGLVHGLRQESPGTNFRIPVPQAGQSTPRWYQRAAAFLRIVVRKLRPAAAWNSLDPSWRAPADGIKSAGTTVATHSFDAQSTQVLTQKARARGVSLNSFMFSAVARVCASELAQGPAMWMMPINMRGLVPTKRETANHLSFLPIEIDRGATPSEVHGAVKRALRKGEHWGIWLYLNVGRFVGYSGMRLIYLLQNARVERRLFVGAFSNMGNWDGIGQWFICPPVTYSCPLGVGAITCDGHLSLTIDAHPSIARDPAWVQALMKRLVADLEM